MNNRILRVLLVMTIAFLVVWYQNKPKLSQSSSPAESPPTPSTYTVRMESDRIISPARITLPGGQVMTLEPGQPDISFDVPQPLGLIGAGFDEKAAGINIELLGPDGWVPGDNRLDANGRGISIQPLLAVNLLVDNRKLPAGEIRIGQLTIPVKAGDTPRIVFPAPAAAPNNAVALAGRQIGDLGLNKSSTCVIDVAGTRKYYYRTVLYQSTNEPVPPDSSREKIIEPGFLHVIDGDINFFITPAPAEVQTFGGRDSRTEFVDDPD